MRLKSEQLAVICIYTYNFILKMGIQTYCIAGHSVLYINVLYATGTFNARCNGYCTFLCFCIAVTYLKYLYIEFLFGKNQTQNISLLVHFIKNENIFRFLVKSKKGYWGSSLKKSVSLHEYNLFHVRIHVSDDESPKGVWKIVYVGTWYQPKNRLLTNGTPLFFIYCPNFFLAYWMIFPSSGAHLVWSTL